MKPDYAENFSLYTSTGSRKYLNAAERRRALAAMATLEPDQALFALTLSWTGARISEVLALTPASFQIENGVVAFKTLKRRKHSFREVPIPPWLMRSIRRHFKLAKTTKNPQMARKRLWPWHRVTAWRIIKCVMAFAHVAGRQACPRGLRHAFGVGAVQNGVPVTLLQRWMGHARLSTTSIYLDVSGPEEVAFARLFWGRNTRD